MQLNAPLVQNDKCIHDGLSALHCRFADLGAKVVLWDINKKSNDAVAKEIKDKGQSAYSYQCDCSKREEVYRVAEQVSTSPTFTKLINSLHHPMMICTLLCVTQVKQEVGDVTILVNNAGVISGKKFFQNSDEMIDLTFKVNTVAHFWVGVRHTLIHNHVYTSSSNTQTIKAFVPSMIAKNHGYIITIASSAGLFGVSGLMDYCGSKFGAVGIHEALVNELHAGHLDGIHTTVVCPYFINTGMFDGVKTRLPFLLPILEPEYAVNKIMTAFHSNQYMLLMPRILFVFLFCQS